jgi:hypothetical protein
MKEPKLVSVNIADKVAELKRKQLENEEAEVNDAGPKSPEGEHKLLEVETLQIANLQLARENLELKIDGIEQRMQSIGIRIRERLGASVKEYDLAFSTEKPGVVFVQRKPKEDTE